MSKKVSIISALILAAAVIAPALAQTTATSEPAKSAPAMPSQMVLQVGPAGKILLRGTIDAISNGSLTVKSWGGDWTVNVSNNTQVLPAAAGNDITKFKQGDFVGIQGTVSTTANWTIDAAVVRDWTYRKEVRQEMQQNQQSIRKLMQSETPRNYQGTASAISDSSFTLTVNGTAYTIKVSSGAKIVNRNWLSMPLTDIRNGDTVRVWGTNDNGTITASIVRDVSLPASKTTTNH
jgi:hypothetical protein